MSDDKCAIDEFDDEYATGDSPSDEPETQPEEPAEEETVVLGDFAPERLPHTIELLCAWLDRMDAALGTLGGFSDAMGVEGGVASDSLNTAINTAQMKLGIATWLQHRQELKAEREAAE